MENLNENAADDSVGVSVVESKKGDNVTLLLTAADEGNLPTVKDLTQNNGVVVYAKDQHNNTALYIAAQNGHLDIVKYLLDETDVDVNAKNNGGQTVLHLAASSGNLNLVKSLLGKGADFNAKDDNSLAPLLYAARHGHLNVIKYLIEQVGVNVNVICNIGARPLAAYHGHADVVQYLANKENDKVVIFNDRASFLAAAQNGHFDIVKSLPEKSLNSSFDFYNDEGVLSLYVHSFIFVIFLYDMHHKLQKEKNCDLSEIARTYYFTCLLPEDVFKTYLLISTLRGGHKDILKYFIDEKHFNVTVPVGDLGTLLDYAIAAGFTDFVKNLIDEKKVEINSEKRHGETPLIFAVKYNQLDIVKFLISKGATLNSKKLNALVIAAANGNFDMIKYLIQNGADVNEEFKPGTLIDNPIILFMNYDMGNFPTPTYIHGTPLCNAIKSGNLTVVKYLIKHGATVNDNAFNTAVEMGHLKIVRYLKRNWTFNVENDEYKSAVNQALERGHLNVIKYLVERCTILSSDAVSHAASSGKLDIVKFALRNTVNTDYYQEALNNALVNGHLGIAKYLVDEKHFNIQNSKVLLDRVIREGKLNSVKYLVEEKHVDLTSSHINSISRKDSSLFTYIVKKVGYSRCDTESFDRCLFGAINTGNLKLLKHLVNNKTMANFHNDNYWYFNKDRPVMYHVLKTGNSEMANYLIKKGADVNAEYKNDRHGYLSNLTALHLAVANGELIVIENLLRKGADINVKTGSGLTPLDMADLCCNTANANLLKSKGATRKRRSTKFGNNSEYQDNEFAQIHIASSGSTKPSSWLNVFTHTIVQGLVGVSQYLYSSFKPLAIYTIQNSQSSNTVAVQNGDVPSTLLLLDVLIRQFTGQRYISTSEMEITLIEATAVALRITASFESKLKQVARQHKILLESLNIEFIEAQKEVIRKIMSGRMDEISKILRLHVEKAFSDKAVEGAEKELFNEFLVEFNTKFCVALNKILQEPLANRNSTQKINRSKQHEVFLDSKSYLNMCSDSVNYCITDK